MLDKQSVLMTVLISFCTLTRLASEVRFHPFSIIYMYNVHDSCLGGLALELAKAAESTGKLPIAQSFM